MNHRFPVAAFAAARLGFALFTATCALHAQSPAAAPAASDRTATSVLEPFEVTGSRVKRLDYETVSPVVTFSSSSIEEKGYSTLGEFM